MSSSPPSATAATASRVVLALAALAALLLALGLLRALAGGTVTAPLAPPSSALAARPLSGQVDGFLLAGAALLLLLPVARDVAIAVLALKAGERRRAALATLGAALLCALYALLLTGAL